MLLLEFRTLFKNLIKKYFPPSLSAANPTRFTYHQPPPIIIRKKYNIFVG